MRNEHPVITALAILVIGAVMATALYLNNRPDNQDRFTVTGTGTVYAKADIANITVGLKTETKKTAAEATNENTEKMNEIINAVKELGIEEKDIKTTDYRLNPVYNWTEKDGQRLVGYEVSQNVNLKVRELNKISDIISKTTEKGANQIGNISFTIDDEYDLKNEARALAIEKAKEKALLIADQSGMKLGKIKGVHENSYQPMYDYSNIRLEKDMASNEALGMGAGPSIEAGQNEIKVEITLVYAVK